MIPAEMPSGWPGEALMAQAMAARTYALSNLNPEHPSFDLDDTTFFQVYEGSNREHPATNAAVDATRNRIITYGGDPIVAFYFSSGGRIYRERRGRVRRGHIAVSERIH